MLTEPGRSQDPRVSNHGDGCSEDKLNRGLKAGDSQGQNVFGSGEGEWQQWYSKRQLSQRLCRVPDSIPSTWHRFTHSVFLKTSEEDIIIPPICCSGHPVVAHAHASAWELGQAPPYRLRRFHFESGETHWHFTISSPRPKAFFLILFLFLWMYH